MAGAPTDMGSPSKKNKLSKVRDQKQVLDQLLGRQSSKNRPAELNLSRQNSNAIINSIAMGKTSQPTDFDPLHLIATTGTSATNDSIRLLSEFKYTLGTAVSFPPISPQEAREKTRTYSMQRVHSN